MDTQVAKINKMRPFGLELEMATLINQNTLGQILCDNGLPTYITNSHSDWQMPKSYDFLVKPDGSISGSNPSYTWHTAELLTKPFLFQDKYLKKLEKLLRVLNKLGCEVNNTTGFHVHHALATDTSLEALKSLYNLCYRYEYVIYNLVSKSRRGNQYCRMLPSKTRVRDMGTRDNFLTKMGNCRYGCNFSSLKRSNRYTLEFRYHQGTLDLTKVTSWILFTQRLIEHAENRICGSKDRVPNTKANLYNLLYTIGLKPNSKIYKKVDTELITAGGFLVNRWKDFYQENEQERLKRKEIEKEISIEETNVREAVRIYQRRGSFWIPNQEGTQDILH